MFQFQNGKKGRYYYNRPYGIVISFKYGAKVQMLFMNPDKLFLMFVLLGIAAIIITIIAGYFILKALNKWEEKEEKYRNKPKEIIITIRREDDKEKIIEEIVKSEVNNNLTFRDRSQRR
ncbi:hypothetical protein [Wohlfahrtiimonas chitiniclastica]|uniref:hypothetical protein n=2 Tax=Wohlfahrtiimonas chitiniclastica TaxID=400946 RepID=UPI001180543A|nr:hypothetical protein [Wohlfahrtiimonas chitiniclastica]